MLLQTLAVRSALGIRLQHNASLGRNQHQPLSQSSFSMSRLNPTEASQAVNLADALEDVASISEALADYLSRLAKPDSPGDGLALWAPHLTYSWTLCCLVLELTSDDLIFIHSCELGQRH